MNIEVSSTQLVCVDYPAIIKDVDKMLETLGGAKGVTEVHNDPTTRLNLKFRPDDVNCKTLHGERLDTSNLLLKVVVRRRKVRPMNPEQVEVDATGKIVKVEVVGNIQQTYRFKTLCDYQYLPIQQEENQEKYESLLPSLVPNGLIDSSWLSEKCPLLIVPPLFSRIENPSNYHFTKNQTSSNESEDANIIGRARSRRSGYGIFINCEDPTPAKPSVTQGKILKSVGHKKELLESLKKAFAERPVWSSNALTIIAKSDKGQIMKQVLPAFGYYFLTGPWRGLWVRFGYDPRTIPEAKIYQLVDVRIRVPPGLSLSFLDVSRHGQMKLTNKIHHSKATVRIIETEKLQANKPEEETAESLKTDMELRYKYKEGCLPKYKQMFYQLCDIEMDSVKNVIASDKGVEKYQDRDGWFSPGILEKCRQLILADINKSFEKLKIAEFGKGLKQSDQNTVEDDEDYEDYEDDDMYDSDLDEEMDISFD